MPVINGTPGDDFVPGTSGDDTINGDTGNDTLRGNGGADTVNGDDGHDFVTGDAGDDVLHGGNGDDFVRGGAGDDLVDGGAGFDRATFSTNDVNVGVTVDLNLQGVAQNTGHGMDTLVGIEHVSGTNLNDTLTGDGGANWIWGQGGNDTLNGNGGDDLIEVGQGNATVNGGGGTDTLSFFNNQDFAGGVNVNLATVAAQAVYAGSSMTIAGIENVSGSVFNDTITGDGANNVLAGLQGNDTLNGAGGDDTLLGDGWFVADTHGLGFSGPIVRYDDAAASLSDPTITGNDTLNGGAGNDTLRGGGGDDILNGGTDNDLIDGGAGNDTATFVTSAAAVTVDLFFGTAVGDGNDTLVGIETVVGSNFNDFLYGSNNGDTLWGGLGSDTLRGYGGNDAVNGGDGHDYVTGDNGDDTITGGNDDDFLRGGSGNDLIDGGSGVDRVAFSTADVNSGVNVDLRIVGVSQNTNHGMDILIGIENVSGTNLADSLTGNAGDNWIWGQGGNDTLNGDDGNDLIEVGTGNATVNGGNGTDTLSFYSNGDFAGGVNVNLAVLAAQGVAAGSNMTISGVENVSGSLANDTITGDGANNVLAGFQGNDTLNGAGGDDILLGDGWMRADTHGTGYSGAQVRYDDAAASLSDPTITGNDTLNGGAGNDTLRGGGGDDVLDGGADNDLIDGGAGIDTASFQSSAFGVTVNLNGGFASGDGNDTLTGIENVIGSSHDDFIVGNGGDNVLSGGGGVNQILGGDGADTLNGGNSGDFLAGDAGNDVLSGNDGDDYLRGGAGDDSFSGGAGYDRIAFNVTGTDAAVGATFNLSIVGVAQNTGHGMDTLVDASVEHVSGTAYNDTLTGNTGDNWIWGQGANDTLNGGDGNDLLEVGVGNSTLNGGNGIDTVSFWNNGTTGPVSVSLVPAGSQATGIGTMRLISIENLSGSGFDDVLTGDNNANVIAGQDGADTISGGGGADTLYGDGWITVDVANTGFSGPIVTLENIPPPEAAFTVAQAGGADYIDGGAGDDRIFGGGGNDTLLGKAGADSLYGGSGDDSMTGGVGADGFHHEFSGGQDVITDFSAKEGDKLYLDGVSNYHLVQQGRDVLVVIDTPPALNARPANDTVLVQGVNIKQLFPAQWDPKLGIHVT